MSNDSKRPKPKLKVSAVVKPKSKPAGGGRKKGGRV